MPAPKEMDVVRRAYELWQQAGEPPNRDQEFYHQARNELQAALDKENDKGPGSTTKLGPRGQQPKRWGRSRAKREPAFEEISRSEPTFKGRLVAPLSKL